MDTTSDEWLKNHIHEMFFCKHYNATITIDTCIRRREIDISTLNKNKKAYVSKCAYCSGHISQVINFSPKDIENYTDYDGSDFPLDESYKLLL